MLTRCKKTLLCISYKSNVNHASVRTEFSWSRVKLRMREMLWPRPSIQSSSTTLWLESIRLFHSRRQSLSSACSTSPASVTFFCAVSAAAYFSSNKFMNVLICLEKNSQMQNCASCSDQMSVLIRYWKYCQGIEYWRNSNSARTDWFNFCLLYTSPSPRD